MPSSLISIKTFLVSLLAASHVTAAPSSSVPNNFIHQRLLEQSPDEEYCLEESAAFQDCTVRDGTISMDVLDCALCTTDAVLKMNYDTSMTMDQRSEVCSTLKSDNYCKNELYECVEKKCPEVCHEEVIAYTNCLNRMSGCDLDCSTSPGFKASARIAVLVGTVVGLAWLI